MNESVGDRPVGGSWNLQRTAQAALIIAVVVAAVWILWRFVPALAWACVLAIATWPLSQTLARRGFGRTTVALLLTLLLAVVLVLPLVGLGIEAARDHGAVIDWIKDVRDHGFGTPGWLARVPMVGESLSSWWQANLAEPGAARSLFDRTETSGIIGFTRTLGLEVANRLTILVFTLLALFFLYRDGPDLIEGAHNIADRLFGRSGSDLGRNAVTAVRGTVNGLVLVGLGEGVLLGIAYWAAGLHHLILLSLATGVLATIPFGAPVIFILCSLYLLGQGQTGGAIGVLVFGTIVVFAADHFVRPILIGNSTRLPFLWVLLGIFGGLESFGLIGLFLGPAIMSVLVAMWRDGARSPVAG